MKINTTKKNKEFEEVWRRFKKNKLAVAGLIVLVLMVIIALIAPIIYDYDTDVIGQDLGNRFQSPNIEHPMGTDNYGRDILTRIIYGSRVSLSIGLIAVGCSLLIGGTIGTIAAYFGGKLEYVLMRIMDVFMALPSILLAIAIVAALGPGIVNLTIAMTIAFIAPYARLLRSLVLPLKDMEFVEAAIASGASTRRIIISHIIPNTVGPVLVQSTLAIGRIIIAAAGLSFLGLGIIPPQPEWGSMLSEGKEYMRTYNYMVIFPGLAIMITVLSLNVLGDGLNDAIDPRLNN
ncbi:MAG: ABC transporter permease [Bacillota bacterium]|nr:ABC transporter permease [Bacillota bacterium]